jgi:hypothetical protein
MINFTVRKLASRAVYGVSKQTCEHLQVAFPERCEQSKPAPGHLTYTDIIARTLHFYSSLLQPTILSCLNVTRRRKPPGHCCYIAIVDTPTRSDRGSHQEPRQIRTRLHGTGKLIRAAPRTHNIHRGARLHYRIHDLDARDSQDLARSRLLIQVDCPDVFVSTAGDNWLWPDGASGWRRVQRS